MRAILLAAFLVLFHLPSLAEDGQWSITAGDRAYHADRSHNYNEVNKFVAIHYNEWLVGTLENSIRRRSFLIANQVREPFTENLSLGYSLTIITGYSHPNYPHVFPFLGATYTLGALGDFGSHIAIDFNTNYVLSEVGIRYILNPKTPARKSRLSEPGLYALGYSYGYRGARLDGYYDLSLAHPNWPRGLVAGASVEYGKHTREDWVSSSRFIRNQKASNKGGSITLAWYPSGNKWLGAYAGANLENIKYVSSFTASSLTKDEAAKHGVNYFVLSGQKLPLTTNITETIEWKNRVAPTVGLRLGNPFGGQNRLTGFLDIGASHIGEPAQAFTSTMTGTIHEADVLADKVAKYRWVPTVQVGVNYKF